MGRCLFARRSSGTLNRLGATLAVVSLLISCSGVDAARRPDATAASSGDLEAVSTLDITGLQSHFAKVAKNVSGSVVAISASITPMDSDEVLRTESLNP